MEVFVLLRPFHRRRSVDGRSRSDPNAAPNPSRHRRPTRAALASGAALLLLTAAPAGAVTQDGQVWLLGTARIALAEKVKLYLEAQPRIGGEGMRQLLLRPALGYQVFPSWALYQGYGWTPSFDPFNDENRVYQESLLDYSFGALRTINRTRLEERFIEGVHGVSLRLRHMLRLTYPLDDEKKWFVAVSDEPFVTLNDATNGPQSGFDQNRAYVGLRRQLSSSVGVELGYLHQYVNKNSDDDLSNNNAFVWIDVSI